MQTHHQILSWTALKKKAASYLEIGIDRPEGNFMLVDAPTLKTKIGVDPDPEAHATFTMASDEFFQQLPSLLGPRMRFDLVFIDGLHHSDQVLRDICNAAAFLEPGGTIVCHDLLPADEHRARQLQPDEKLQEDEAWNGDCWKAFALYASVTPFKFFTLDCEQGLGFIDFSKPRDVPFFDVPDMASLTWQDFLDHSSTWLNRQPLSYLFDAI